jgi:hypothetical protein
MRHALLSHLHARRAPQSLINAWESAAQQKAAANERSPCPECFLGGGVVELEAIPGYGDLGQVRCPRCRTVFLFARR